MNRHASRFFASMYYFCKHISLQACLFCKHLCTLRKTRHRHNYYQWLCKVFPVGSFHPHDPRNASLDEITHLMWEESKETDQGPDDLEHLVLKHLKSMNNPMMITMINNTCLSLVSFSMKYLRNKLLSSTRKLQITFLLEICDSSIQSG